MIIVGLLSGICVGLISAALMALLGYGLFVAFLAYVVGGVIGMVLMLTTPLLWKRRNATLPAAEARSTVSFGQTRQAGSFQHRQ